MAVQDLAHDTIQSPAPESGEFAVAQIEIAPGSGEHAPHYVESVVAELRAAVASLHCPEHGAAPALTVDFGTDDAGTVAVVRHDCCAKLDDLVATTLRDSPIFRVMRTR